MYYDNAIGPQFKWDGNASLGSAALGGDFGYDSYRYLPNVLCSNKLKTASDT